MRSCWKWHVICDLQFFCYSLIPELLPVLMRDCLCALSVAPVCCIYRYFLVLQVVQGSAGCDASVTGIILLQTVSSVSQTRLAFCADCFQCLRCSLRTNSNLSVQSRNRLILFVSWVFVCFDSFRCSSDCWVLILSSCDTLTVRVTISVVAKSRFRIHQ